MQDGWTALHKVCGDGKVEVARTLIENGASIDLKNDVRLLYVMNACCVRRNGVSGLDRLFCRHGLHCMYSSYVSPLSLFLSLSVSLFLCVSLSKWVLDGCVYSSKVIVANDKSLYYGPSVYM